MLHLDLFAGSSEVLCERRALLSTNSRAFFLLLLSPPLLSLPPVAMATARGYSPANGLAHTAIDRVSANAATPPMTDSQLLPAPPPAAMLPPPPPARDLHGARARITLEKIKLEIESVREVLGDVNGLGEAVKGLQNQVELLLAERAAQGTHRLP